MTRVLMWSGVAAWLMALAAWLAGLPAPWAGPAWAVLVWGGCGLRWAWTGRL